MNSESKTNQNVIAGLVPAISLRRAVPCHARALIKQYRGDLKAAYAALGVVDLVFVVNLPDTARTIAVSAALAKGTSIAFTTAPAVSVEEFR